MGVCEYKHTRINVHVYTGDGSGVEGSRVGAHSSFSDRKFPALAGTSPLNSGFSLRKLPERASVRGTAGGRERHGKRPQGTHILVIHGAHRTSPSAAGRVPRRPAPESDIAQPLLGDGHWAEQLHVSVPFAHMSTLLPSHSKITLSGAAAPPEAQPSIHIVAALRFHRDAFVRYEGVLCADRSHAMVAHRTTPGFRPHLPCRAPTSAAQSARPSAPTSRRVRARTPRARSRQRKKTNRR